MRPDCGPATLDDEMLSPSFYSPEKRRLRVVNLQGGETIRVYDTLGRQQVVRQAAGATDEFEIESGVYVIRIGQKNPVKGVIDRWVYYTLNRLKNDKKRKAWNRHPRLSFLYACL